MKLERDVLKKKKCKKKNV